MKAPLRPFEYMNWAKTVPRGARYNLTASGMSDTAALVEPGNPEATPPAAQPFADSIDLASQCTRAAAEGALVDFKRAVADRYGVDPELVTPTLGASLAITHVLIALVRAGDHVIVERPTYEPLHRAPLILGARVSRLERKPEEGWAVVPDRLARLLTPKTRAVILSNLHNPSGVAIDSESLSAITDLASRVGAMVLVDEVYLDYAFDISDNRAFGPVCRAAPNGISWSSTTKGFGFSAVRAGWIVAADVEVAKAIRGASDYLHVYPPVTTLQLGSRILKHSESLLARATTISNAGRETIDRWLEGESRVSWVPPTAGLTGLLRLPEHLDDQVFAEHLRTRYDTQVVPGAMFEATGSVRVSFGIDPAELKTALANISAALDDLA